MEFQKMLNLLNIKNFDANIVNDNCFKSFKYKAKLLGDTVAQPAPNQANGILKLQQFVCH